MKNIIIYTGILFLLGGCSLIPASGKRYKNHLNSFNGDNIKEKIKTRHIDPDYVESRGESIWYYTHSYDKRSGMCKFVFITTSKDIIVDNIIQTPETCKSGFSGVF